MGRPWNGDYVFSSGDLVEDLTHNFFLETGARNNKHRVLRERALTARDELLRVAGALHLRKLKDWNV
jgi:Mn-containing catalase